MSSGSKCCNCTCASGTAHPVKVDAYLKFTDYIKHILIRFGIGRYKSRVKPGIYSVGSPGGESPVFVSSNFTMSFDLLRASLKGIDAWILVIDTKGINVWCAAGKGTFGSDEIIKKVKGFKLAETVKHRTLILPLLGAPGASSIKIKKETGFRVVYGPVYARDIKKFLDNNMKTTPAMRKIGFNLLERTVLIPMELIPSLKYVLYALIYIYITSFIASGFDFSSALINGYPLTGALILSLITGCILTPALLTWLPFRSFTLKGIIMGFAGQAAYLHFAQNSMNLFQILGSFLIFPLFSGYLALNFTGSTTFTNPSGVRKEIRLFLKPLIFASIVGAILITLGTFGVL